MAYSPRLWLMPIGWWNKINQCRKLKLNLTQTWGVCMSLDSGLYLKISDTVMTSRERNKFRAQRSKRTQSLKHFFKKVSVSNAQLAHFSTCFSSWASPHTFITNARTPRPFARLHSQMVCTQSEPAELPQHMFVQILVQVGGDRKWGRWTCSERGACSLNLPRPSSLWAEETLFLSVFIFFWGLFSSPTLFAATGQQPACSWFPFSAEQ